jgi:hypothetical protein
MPCHEHLPAVANAVELKGMTNTSDIPALEDWYEYNIDLFKVRR